MHHPFYRLMITLLSPIIFGHVIWLAIKNKQSRYFWQRLGFNYSALPTGCLWFHCASVGEVNTLLPLLKNLHTKNQQLKFIITTNTITGAKIVKQQKLDYLFHSYLPFDWIYSVKRFLSKTQSTALYVMETEIWPNLFTICHKRNIPVYIINARLSTKTTAANTWIKSLLKFSLSNVHAVYARSEKDAEAYKQLGSDAHIVHTTGNLKLCTAMSSAANKNPRIDLKNRDYVLVASTHQDEEKQIYTLWKTLNRNELLVIAPRHPERSSSILKQLDCEKIARRSKNETINEQTEVFLLDTVGELKDLFSEAKLVIMGGSFVSVGGHNIMEPASYNSAIITGPQMKNFAEELALMLDNEAIVQVASYSQLKQRLARLLDDKQARQRLESNTEKISHDAEKVLSDYTDIIMGNVAESLMKQ